MSACVGAGLSVFGVIRMVDVFDKGIAYLKYGVGYGDPKLSTCKAITRIAANVLYIIGLFCAALGMLTMGATLISAAPEMAFLIALDQAIFAALPHLLIALGTISASLITRHIGS